MSRISRTIALAGVFLAPFWGGGCQEKAQESGDTSTAQVPEGSEDKSKKGNQKPLTKEEEFQALLAGCATAGEGATLAKIADVVALINKLPKPVSIPCFLAAVPRSFQVGATTSLLSFQPAKDKVNPRYVLHMNGLLITASPEGTGKEHLEFSEIIGSESVKGDLVFPITADLEANAPYAGFFDKIQGKSSCALCHRNERLMGNGYPAEATISVALRAKDATMLLRYEVEELKTLCAKNLSNGCKFNRAIFYGDTLPPEYKFPTDMPELNL